MNLERKEVESFIEELQERGLLDPKKVEGKVTWRIRTAGKALVGLYQVKNKT